MPVGARAISINDILKPHRIATDIATKFQQWDLYRAKWLAEKREIRNYVFATDTTQTSNSMLPWKNSTHVPKLCQIRDNLRANYMAALFPTDRPIRWEGDDESSEAKDKRLAIEAYMENKLRQSGFQTEIGKLIDDYIDFGNCFGMVQFIAENTVDPATGEQIQGYVGPRLERISPLDITFNPIARSFDESPKIIRSLKTLAHLKAEMIDHPELQFQEEIFDKMLTSRRAFVGMTSSDYSKSQEFQIDGFTDFLVYLQSEYVEVLDFYGDYYDHKTGVFHRNQIITVVDRAHVIRHISNPSWLGKAPIFHAGWRLRPDNLYAMGPLDNLIGMQYRIDHLENAKADAYDLIIHPVIKVKGLVEDFDYGPNERIFCGDDGDVEFMNPDTTMLAADTQIAMYQQQMEEMAGAPKQAMGFRTPGEKTAYEVQVLENGANRIFINKTAHFEECFVEPVLNAMLEMSRRNMGPSETIKILDNDFAVVSFMKVTKEDLAAKGKIRPIGARHFARNANMIQNLTNMYSSAIGQDPAVSAHVSGKTVAKMIEELLGLERYKLVQDNIRIVEQLETQQLAQSGSQILAERGGGAPADPNMQPATPGNTGTPSAQ